MRGIRPSGSEGGVALTAPSLPLPLRTMPLVDRDSATRQARRWDVRSDVGELSFGS
jgi:hypothetical protein